MTREVGARAEERDSCAVEARDGRVLWLIRHAAPLMDPDRPASVWTLTERGRREAEALAERLSRRPPGIFLSSPEPKAVETAMIAAAALGREVRIVDGLGEHARETVPFFDDLARFEAGVRESLTEPDRLVFGEETADEAYRRFVAALEEALAGIASGDVAVVAHGTVIALTVARANGLDPWSEWRGIETAAAIPVSLPGFELLEPRRASAQAPDSP